MTIELRQGNERGQSRYGGWLQSYHSFSFADYLDPEHVQFSALRVLNDDTVRGGGGFPPHPHRDMEIISYVTDGGLAHRDSMGNGSVIHTGEFQRMSAGSGVVHSEYNISATEDVHFFQIWITPDESNLPPTYEQRRIDHEDKRDQLCLVASGDRADGALYMHQDCSLYISRLTAGTHLQHTVQPDRCAYIHVVEGELQLNDTVLKAGDGAGIRESGLCRFSAATETEFILFDLP